jgi:hypothetical protein
MSTPLHRGTGSSPADPVNRTKSNLVSSAPESTVVSHVVDATTRTQSDVDTNLRNADHYFTLAQWFGGAGGGWAAASAGVTRSDNAMAQFLRFQMSEDELPLPRSADASLAEFEQKALPEFCAQFQVADATLAKAQWTATARRYRASVHLLDRSAFDTHLASCDEAVRGFFGKAAAGDNSADDVNEPTGRGAASTLARLADLLRRDAVRARNRQLKQIIAFVNSSTLQGGQAVWTRFFGLVDSLREPLLHSDDAVRAQYELASADKSLPAMKPATALLFALVTSAASRRMSGAGNADLSKHASGAASSGDDVLHLLTKDEILRFVSPRLPALLVAADLHVFARLGLHNATQRLAEVHAIRQTARVERRKKAGEIAHLFGDASEAESLITRVLNAPRENLNAAPAAERIHTVLKASQPLTDGPSVERAMRAAGWKANYKELALELLTSSAFVELLKDAIKSELSTANKNRPTEGVVTTEANKLFLESIIDTDKLFVTKARDAVAAVQWELLDSIRPATLLSLLQAHGVDTSPVHKLAARRREELQVEGELSTDASAAAVESLIAEVGRRNPKWVEQGIMPAKPSSDVSPQSAAAVRLLLHMFLRMSYVPNAGAAVIAQRFRNRIGPIAQNPEQTNLEAEVGYVEAYDNQQFKNYDWAAWYQRMTDVYNRNVSIRCKLSNLRALDNYGKPFIDLQTERRLRVLAGERVANGVLKLDNDRFEDQKDNLAFGFVKVQELLSEAKKAQLGEEYWPSVEVKVRRPSGQSRMRYSLLDWDRVEKASEEAFERYAVKKRTTLFVPPTETWLKISGTTTSAAKATSDAEGYTVDSLFESLDSKP